MDHELLDEFRLEAEELISEAEEALLAIEAVVGHSGDQFDELYQAIFRVLHSLKGSAGMFDLTHIQDHVHKLEDLFQKSNDSKYFTKEFVDYFLKGIDVTKELIAGKEKVENFDYIHSPSENIKNSSNVTPIDSNKNLKSDIQNSDNNNLPLIYILDDEKIIVDILVDQLSEIPCRIEKFFHAHDLLKALGKNMPNLILSDIKMPDMTGLQMAQKISLKNPDLPIIFITGHFDASNCIEALNMGIYGIITKPISRSYLLMTVKNALKEIEMAKLLDQSIKELVSHFGEISDFLESNNKHYLKEAASKSIKNMLEKRHELKRLQALTKKAS